MDNLERLKMEIEGYKITDEKLQVYLQENNLVDNVTYDPTSNTNKKAIYQTALAILESISNDPQNMKNYKTDDVSITHFHTNLMRRIDYLNRKIRMMPSDDDFGGDGGASIGYLFTE